VRFSRHHWYDLSAYSLAVCSSRHGQNSSSTCVFLQIGGNLEPRRLHKTPPCSLSSVHTNDTPGFVTIES
jgi:hypothetical protein